MTKHKIEHKITWEINTLVKEPESFFAKLMTKLGHTKVDVHTYLMDIEVSAIEGDSLDSMLNSIMTQLKHITIRDDHKISAHNGLRRTKFVRNDLL